MGRIVKIIAVYIIIGLTATLFNQTTQGGEVFIDTPDFSSQYLFNFQSQSPSFNRFESRFERFLEFWNIKGATVAVAQNGKLIYTKGFGYADVANNTLMEPYHMMRVASVSKLVTAVAVMKLVEEGKISLNDKVFGQLGILNTKPYLDYRDPRMEEITVKHLLNHSGGWTTRYGDPLFSLNSLAKANGYAQPLSSEDVIAIMLTKRLHFNPGTSSRYSNLGFIILGKVIEKASGMDYERYVKSQILYPLGIFDMQLGRSYRSQRFALEANYYEQPDAELIPDISGSGMLVEKSNGGNNIEALDAAGGWVASATDLMKFLLAIDGYEKPADILSVQSINTMVSVDQVGFSPLGWRSTNVYGQWVRTGTLAGSSVVMKRFPDGLCYVILCNTSPWVGSEFPLKMASFADTELERIDILPDINLFAGEAKLAVRPLN
jgi:CubicO group peptidase (beta-lactamase class C family)